ncbi:TGF-beta-activated kinase 1 and MAP3K7-binding protein 1-like isoform X1 [Rhodnius prolixus]|uniref:TGF-beta-activated kinase 1 and MAP3K7-binding protein 1-like isoform X1 n=1 Tax=Rhodnius prolixus TaxID=13249 RepID=UPI003D18CB87
MPTTADIERRRNYSYPAIHSWTDDLPVCRKSGVGFATNQVYREDGHRQEKHPFEDTSFHSGSKEDGGTTTYLYGVFDGHYGIEAAQFAVQGLAAELLLGQLSGKIRDQDIKEALSQAFVAVEKNYLESLDDLVAKRTSLQFQIPDGITSYEAYQNYPHIVDQINSLNGQLSCGTTAVVALIVGTRLYVANVGDSRALLCKTDKHGVHKVVQVSADHNLTNEDEILRLYNLGLDFTPASRKSCCTLGNQENTRCLGNYLVKGAYREFEELAPASEEPIIAEPEIQGGIELDESCCFLLLMSAGLYKSLEEATDSTQVNKDIVQMAIAEFREQKTLTGVAQAVVDRVVRLHTDKLMSSVLTNEGQAFREDMTLLVRRFNISVNTTPTQPNILGPDTLQVTGQTVFESNSTSSGGLSSQAPPPPVEIPPYVDFSEFYRNIAKARKDGILPPELEDML